MQLPASFSFGERICEFGPDGELEFDQRIDAWKLSFCYGCSSRNPPGTSNSFQERDSERNLMGIFPSISRTIMAQLIEPFILRFTFCFSLVGPRNIQLQTPGCFRVQRWRLIEGRSRIGLLSRHLRYGEPIRRLLRLLLLIETAIDVIDLCLEIWQLLLQKFAQQ